MNHKDIAHIREAWNGIAAGFDRYVTPTNDWALPKDVLNRVGLRPGMRFLDVASGSGALSIPAARIGAKVLAVDLSPVMIERLTARAREEGLTDLEGRVMDGHALELEDDTFDVSGSQFGVMLFPDMPRALRELVRVTRPGGRVFLVVFAPPPKVEFLGIFVEALGRVVPDFGGFPTDPPPLPFQAADPEVLRTRLAEAGLEDVRIENGVEKLEFESGQQMWDWVINSNPIPVMMTADLTQRQKADVIGTLDEMLRRRSGGSGPAVLETEVHIGIGTTGG